MGNRLTIIDWYRDLDDKYPINYQPIDTPMTLDDIAEYEEAIEAWRNGDKVAPDFDLYELVLDALSAS